MKKAMVIGIIIIVVILLFPIRTVYQDGGSIEYKSILYKITELHKLDIDSKTGYFTGKTIEIVGIKVFDNTLEHKKEEEVQVDNNCLNNILAGYIANNSELKVIGTKEITSLDVDYNSNVIYDNKYMYSIVKTDNSKVIDEFNNYYKNKYSNYYYKNFTSNYYIYLYNGIENVDPTSDILSCFK